MNDWLDDAVRREGKLLFSDHPESRHLVLFHESPEELPAADRHAVTAHLRVCDACADDLARLRAAGLELAAAAESGAYASALGAGWRGRLTRLLAPRFLVPALSLAVAGFALLGLPGEPGESGEPGERGTVQPVGRAVVLRAEAERGGAPVVNSDPDGRIALTFVLPDDGQGPVDRCDVTILDADGVPVTRLADVPAFDAYGTFVLTVDMAALSAGPHMLVARDRLGEQRFPFDLRPAQR